MATYHRKVAFCAITLAGALIVLGGLPPSYEFLSNEAQPYNLPMISVGAVYIVVGAGLLSGSRLGYAVSVLAAIVGPIVSAGGTIMGTFLALALFLLALPLVWESREANLRRP